MHEDIIGKYITEIEEDKQKTGSYKRYPVRFVFFEDTIIYSRIVSNFTFKGVEIIEVESLLKKSDGWIDYTGIFELIKGLKRDKDFVILGFSEIVRFYKKAELESLVISLITDIENSMVTGDSRIYILCLGLYDFISKICGEKHNRFNVFNPFIGEKTFSHDAHINMYFTEVDNINELPEVQVSSVKEWLNLWNKERNIFNPLICTSKTLNYWYSNAKPDTVFSIERLANEKEIINKILGFDIYHEYNDNEKIYWNKLLKDAYKCQNKTTVQLFEYILDVNNLSKTDIIKIWGLNNNVYHRWIIKLLITNYDKLVQTDGYSKVVFKSMVSFDNNEFCRAAWMLIFEIDEILSEWYAQRKNLLKKIYELGLNYYSFEKDLEEAISKVNKIENLLEVLTATSFTEKKKIISLYSSGQICSKVLAELYPEGAAYVSGRVDYKNLTDNNTWVNSYFSRYINAKVKNSYTEELKEAITTYNACSSSFFQWYYRIECIDEILKRENFDRIILIDGLGAEWSSLVSKIMTEQEFYIKNVYLGRGELPSITKYNNEFNGIKPDLVIGDFDEEVIHGKNYSWPESIIKSIDYIKEIFEKKIILKANETVAIVSDHGSTVTHRLVNDVKLYNFDQSEHDGRCMICKQDIPENQDYIIYTNKYNEKWLIALNHISLYKKSTRHVHGGATPEEVIIPVYIVSKSRIKEDLNYNITLLKGKITGLDKTISFAIQPRPKTEPFLIDEFGKKYQLNNVNGAWQTELKIVRKQEITIFVGSKKETFLIKTTFEEGDLF